MTKERKLIGMIFLALVMTCTSACRPAMGNETSHADQSSSDESTTIVPTTSIDAENDATSTERKRTTTTSITTTSTVPAPTSATSCTEYSEAFTGTEETDKIETEESTVIDDVPFLVVTEEATTEIASEPYEATLNATVLNVGQSSCTILESDGEYMVVDAADPEHRTTVIDYLDRNGISNIQYLVFTHYDNDHIGAGDDLVKRADLVIGPEYKDSKKLTKKESIHYTSVGDTFILGECFIEVIAPTRNQKYKDDNDYSVSMIISDDYDNRLYIGGDSSTESEHEQVNRITDSVDVYIVNHHGSKTSSNANFLYRLYPSYAIISCGKNNRYGHPHQVTLDKLMKIGCEIHRTDLLTDDQNICFSFSTNGVEFGS